MTLEELKKRRDEERLTYVEISERSGIPLPTVQKIFGGVTTSPRYETMQALERALFPEHYSYGDAESEVSAVKEPADRYGAAALIPGKSQGEFTLDDYYALPEDRRVELIDGVLYDMAAPRMVHQLIAGELYHQLYDCIAAHHRDCVAFMAPADVQLGQDNKTMVQPDVFVVCDRTKIHDKVLFGAPDFVIEVLSSSTRKKDMELKSYKYQNAGVLEYWLVDPDAKKVIVHVFGQHPDIFVYGFDDVVPVASSEGTCSIDFRNIYEHVRFLYPEDASSV